MRVYKLFVLGYGCEVVIGTVSNHLISYFSEHLDIANAIVSNNIDWRDIDDQFHFFGPADSFTVVIIDENEKEIFKADSENIFEKGNNFDFKAVCESPNINLDNNLLMGISLQKGVVFEGTFEADCFESDKLVFKTIDNLGIGVAGYEIKRVLKSIIYNFEEIMNSGAYAEEKEFLCCINF